MKVQISLQVNDDTINKLEQLTAKEKISHNNIISKAIDFYYGYVTSSLSQEYLCSVFGQKVEGIVNSAADRSARLQFKEAVELNLLTRLIASNFEIDRMSYDKLRKKAVEDVKATKGIINIYDAQK
ncbi:MAG: hypothetical protein U0L73_05525 [Ruminococcus bromii]|nr:hypothetical protein [Ruminococcus bromii]